MTEEKSSELMLRDITANIDSKNLAVKKDPLANSGLSNDETEQLTTEARRLAQQLENAHGSKEMELIDSFSGLGLAAQRQAAADLNLLKARVGDTLARQDPTGQVTTDLIDLRVALEEIVPAELSHPSLFGRLLDMVPFHRRVLKLLEGIALRYEPVSRQVLVIESRLRQGRIMLTRDNVELRKLYEQIESRQPLIQKNACFGELLMQELSGLMERTELAGKKERIQSALHDVAMRVQDLRAMEKVHFQFFVSIEMTRQNNTRLGQAVERTLALATNVVTVGLAIQIALTRQKRIMDANRHTRNFLGDMIVANAETIKRHTREIGDVYNEPVIAVEKITQAHNALLEAMDTAEQLRQEGIACARENISKLNRLAGALEERFLNATETAEAKS